MPIFFPTLLLSLDSLFAKIDCNYTSFIKVVEDENISPLAFSPTTSPSSESTYTMPPLVTIPSNDSTEESALAMTSQDEEESSSLPSTMKETKTKKCTKTVTFKEQVTVYDHIHIKNVSPEEKARAWHSKQDLLRINAENDVTIERILLGDCDGIHYCARGLESRTSVGHRTRAKHRSEAINAVMEYQNLQWESGVEPNVENLARVYSDHTRHSTQVARLHGLVDQQRMEEDLFQEVYEAKKRLRRLRQQRHCTRPSSTSADRQASSPAGQVVAA